MIFEKKETTDDKLQVRCAYREEWEDAISLAWSTFMKFEAADYTPRGVKSFWEFITDPVLQRMFAMGAYQLFVAIDKGKIVGMISLRNETHISLLFVDAAYHKQGIGRALISYLCRYVDREEGHHSVTVNAAPYALGFYHKLGFEDTGAEESNDGIRFTPMKRVWEMGQV